MAYPVEPVRRIDLFSRALEAVDTRVIAATTVESETPKPHVAATTPRAWQSLSLPLPDIPEAGPAMDSISPPANVAADVNVLSGGLSHEAVRDLAQETLRSHADAVDQSPSRYAAATPEIPADALPSRNHAGSHSRLQAAFLADTGSPEPVALDLHLARHGTSLWEAAVFDREGVSIAGGFPYAAAPLHVSQLQFDDAHGQFVLPDPHRMLVPLLQPQATQVSPSLMPLAIAIALAAAAIMLFAADRIVPGCVCLCAAILAVISGARRENRT